MENIKYKLKNNGGGIAMSSIGGLNFPAVWGVASGGPGQPEDRPMVSRLTVVSRGLIYL